MDEGTLNKDFEFAQAESNKSLFSGDLNILEALGQLRTRLLDLTGRNRLINFKHSPGKSLQFVHSDVDGIVRRLTSDNLNKVTIAALPEPNRIEWVNRNGRLVKPEPKDHAMTLGLSTSFELKRSGLRSQGSTRIGSSASTQLQTLLYAEDLGLSCRKLERESRLAIEETGANMLYLVIGYLEYQDSPNGEKLYQAPLLCLPVALGRKDDGQFSTFYLNSTGEELVDNLSLREKLHRDFGVNLPEYDAEDEGSIETYLDAVEGVAKTLPNWRMRRMMTLTLLSFTNMLLVRDLDPAQWALNAQDGQLESALLTHPLVQQVFAGKSDASSTHYAGEYSIDEHPKGDLPLIYDADSSQHSALIDVLEGKNRVIEGPPGTGKSQTITNLIAAAMQAGKKVLFVAEKLAALEVVKSRLTQAGLDAFVLELHSNKTNKKRILEDLESRVNLNIPRAPDLPDLLARQATKRAELKAYMELMRQTTGAMDITLHQVLWRAERHRLRCIEFSNQIESIIFETADSIGATPYQHLVDQLHYLSEQHILIRCYGSEHPFWGLYAEELKPGDELQVRNVLTPYVEKFATFEKACAQAAIFLGGENLNMSARSAELLLNVLSELAPANPAEIDFAILPALFNAQDPNGQLGHSTLLELHTLQKALERNETLIEQHLTSRTPVTVQVAEHAQKVLLRLRELGVENHTSVALQSAESQINGHFEAVQKAQEILASTAKWFSLSYDGQRVSAQRIQLLTAALETAPFEQLHLRHDGLRSPSSISLLEDSQNQLTQIQGTRTELQSQFYMDMLPSTDAMREAILTLREGATWYRFFQSPWRRAIRLHRTLQKIKGKKNPLQRLDDLERIVSLGDKHKAWMSNDTMLTATGTHFSGEQTPFTGLIACAKWAHAMTIALEASSLRPEILDPFTADRIRLLEGSRQGQQVTTSLGTLNDFEQDVKKVMIASQTGVLKQFETTHWPTFIQLTQEVAGELRDAHQLLDSAVKINTPAQVGLLAMMETCDIPAQLAKLEHHVAGKAIFGSRYAGRHTSLERAMAAHTFGSQVKKAGLPVAIEHVLLSERSLENHEQLEGFTKDIDAGWQAVADFSNAMQKCGRFEPTHWADPSNKSSFLYAQELNRKTSNALLNMVQVLPWAQYLGARKTAVSAGLEEFVLGLESGAIPADRLTQAFGYRFYASVAQGAFSKHASLRQFSGTRHSAVRTEYAALDKEIIRLRGRQIANDCRYLSDPPVGINGVRVDDKTEMRLLEHLIPQQRPRVTVRKMLKRAGKAIQELKPCFMMGPQAVAQFLEPGHLHFDIVVMDEASQLRPEEAIGAIARGTQLVVVGDPKQLPPTSFFARMSAQDDDGTVQMATTDAESILDVCISHFQPVRTLRWHYRSQHESLIAFSNHHFYRGDLVVFPSPYPKSKTLGLRYHHVANGVYENQMNHIEASRVVDAAVEHILQRPDSSLGIVTLNVKQRDLVAELLEERLRSVPQATEFKEKWNAVGMGLFIKNLENVQGDERDCIMISTTFGKPAGASVVRQNFGPISRQGGWRRLNVLFTRARKSIAVISSMRAEDIVVDSRTPEGTKALRNYLEYARTGVMPIERETGLPPDSDFEIAVMDVLKSKGYEVTPQLGVAGFRIDLAVKHPKHLSGYLAAIECDGAAYHSGISVRDRDRIRQEILENLGWKGRIWRIWSTDWFRNPVTETDRLLQFLQFLSDSPVPDAYIEESVPEPEIIQIIEPSSRTKVEKDLQFLLESEEAQRKLVFLDEEALEVEVGDLVTYAAVDSVSDLLMVKLTRGQTDLASGLVSQSAPLGATLMGASLGDEVVLRVPGKPAQIFRIKNIFRPA